MEVINKVTELCSGSRVLAWLLTVTGASGAICMLWLLTASLLHVNAGIADRWFALSASPQNLLAHPWTPVSYMLVHYSPLHLLFNLLWLYWFGRILADIHSDRTLLYLFLGAGIAGALTYVVTSLITGIPRGSYLTGDSAAVLGVMTATGILLPDIRLRLFLFGEVRLKWVALACVLLTLAGGTSGGAGAQAAHLGGAAWGVIFSLVKKSGYGSFGSRLINKISLPGVNKCNGKKSGRHDPRRISEAMQMLDDHQRLDELLDKIRISGYDALSEREKTELNHISSRLEK